MENNKIYYDKNGWVFDRNLEDLNQSEKSEKRTLIVGEEAYNKTFFSPLHFAWKVENGELVNMRYEETPTEEIQAEIRSIRENEVFPIIDRSKLWYESLSDKQIIELRKWYKDWLNAPRTLSIPEKPKWLKN